MVRKQPARSGLSDGFPQMPSGCNRFEGVVPPAEQPATEWQVYATAMQQIAASNWPLQCRLVVLRVHLHDDFRF